MKREAFGLSIIIALFHRKNNLIVSINTFGHYFLLHRLHTVDGITDNGEKISHRGIIAVIVIAAIVRYYDKFIPVFTIVSSSPSSLLLVC